MNKVALEIILQETRDNITRGMLPPLIKVFATSVQHCKDIVNVCNTFFKKNSLDLRADYLAGKRKDENADVIDEAKRGLIQVVVSDRMAIAGLDIPNIQAVINLCPAGPIEATQRFGRALRRYDEHNWMHFTALAIVPGLNPKLVMGLSTQEQTVRGYDVISRDMRPGVLISDILEGAVCYPQKTAHRNRKPAFTSEDDELLDELPSFEVISSIEKVSALRKARSSLNRQLRASDVTREEAIKLVEIYRQHHKMEFPNQKTTETVRDDHGEALEFTWGTLDKYHNLAELKKIILDREGLTVIRPSETTKEQAIQLVQIFRQHHKMKFPSQKTTEPVKDEHANVLPFTWTGLNGYHNLAELKKIILAQEGVTVISPSEITEEQAIELVQIYRQIHQMKFPSSHRKEPVTDEHRNVLPFTWTGLDGYHSLAKLKNIILAQEGATIIRPSEIIEEQAIELIQIFRQNHKMKFPNEATKEAVTDEHGYVLPFTWKSLDKYHNIAKLKKIILAQEGVTVISPSEITEEQAIELVQIYRRNHQENFPDVRTTKPVTDANGKILGLKWRALNNYQNLLTLKNKILAQESSGGPGNAQISLDPTESFFTEFSYREIGR